MEKPKDIEKIYVVKKGRTTGLFTSWEECQNSIHGYSGAVFKSFHSRREAEAYLQHAETPLEVEGVPYSYMDGSYSKTRGIYGYGGFLVNKSNCYIIQGTGNNPKYLPERNIAGEVFGALQALFLAYRLHLPEIILYSDFQGIRDWATGDWRTKTPLTQYYKSTIDLLNADMKIDIIHIKGHTGIEENEIADLLAKDATGVIMAKKDQQKLEQFKKEKGGNAIERH